MEKCFSRGTVSIDFVIARYFSFRVDIYFNPIWRIFKTPFPISSLTMSPRSQQRSKSLTITGSPNSIDTKRKLSVSSLESLSSFPKSSVQNLSQNSTIIPIEEDDDVQIIERFDEIETEIIEESDENDDDMVEVKYREEKVVQPQPLKVPLSKVHQESPAKLLKWENQIGNLTKCRFKFELNEFGLLEIMEKGIQRNRLDIGYEKPLFERQASASTKENEPLYYCVGCHCKGAAVDFLGPVFCSVECLKRASKRRSSSLKSKIIKSNRRDITSNSLKSLGNNVKSLSKNTTKPESQSQVFKQKFESRIFNWRSYINLTKSEAAPIDLFLNPFPCGPNRFEVGMKLEAIDPENNSKFCVCTVVQVLGYRIKLHFDKFSRIHDFWVNADSMDIFPPGWCTKTNRMLQVPRECLVASKFSWLQYIEKSQGIGAPRGLFTHLNSNGSSNQFKIGMKLEADDVKNTGKICVATVADVIDNRILVHFDGWDECYDYWIEIDSPFIHPINYHQSCEEKEIIGPPGWEAPFRWTDYLLLNNSKAAMDSFFKPRKPLSFCKGMKLEVVDRKNPTIIRPATVVNVNNYSIKVLFDGWSPSYSYWVRDDCPDIHPIGWAENTGHSLEPPPTYSQLPQLLPCSTLGCRGIGNATKPDAESHANFENCPYVLKNWNAPPKRLNRLEEPNGNKEKSRPVPSTNKRKQVVQEEVVDVVTEIQIKQEYDSDADNDKLVIDEKPPKEEESRPRENGVVKEDNTKIEIDESIAVAKQLLYNYGPRLRQNYEVFCKNLNYMMPTGQIPKSNPLLWNVDETYNFFAKITSLSKTAELLKEEEIDGEGLLAMRKDDFTELFKLPLGIAVKMYSIIVRLRCHVFKNFRNSLY
ncbi:L3MBTL3 family protein [Megaselia abdita]